MQAKTNAIGRSAGFPASCCSVGLAFLALLNFPIPLTFIVDADYQSGWIVTGGFGGDKQSLLGE